MQTKEVVMFSHMFPSSKKLLVRSLLTWILFIPVGIINGALREKAYRPLVGELTAHQISAWTGSVAFLILAYFMLHRVVNGTGNKRLFLIGALWVAMTVVFEFGFGHYVSGASWEKLLQDYNIGKGRLWSLVLLTLLAAPCLVKKANTIVFHRKSATHVTG